MSPAVNRARRACPACTRIEFTRLTTVRGTPIFHCVGCGLATWDWPQFDPHTFYNETYWRSSDVRKGYADYFALARATSRMHRERLRWIRQRLAATSSTPRLLDAGCGPGFFVQAAQQAGFDAVGVEVSAAAVQHAREKLGVDVRQGELAAANLPAGPFDVVTLWDVIEHVPEPGQALRDLATVLRPGGLLVLSTGDVSSLVARVSGSRWHLFTLPEHLWFFSANSLRVVLRQAGLRPLDATYEVGWYTLRYLVERLEAMFGQRRKVSSRMGRWGQVAVPMTLMDIVRVGARKGG